MKRTLIFLTSVATLLGSFSYAQVTVGTPQYDQLKASGNLPANVIQAPIAPAAMQQGNKPVYPPSNANKMGCECYQAPDATYTVANFGFNTDDGSIGPIALPFNFCMYGVQYNQFYLNINGNVTFDQAYGTFSAVGFPSASYVMIAPFWGDVDLGGTGTIYYKVTADAVYVNWEQVGYYNSHTDKVNTFQLVFSDGNDAFIPGNDNVAFCYHDMQWTTGDASQGVNGFGGVAATVGVNAGNGTDFIQLGRFDQPGNLYDGPAGNNDGVDWLDNQSLSFNVCTATGNVPPVFGG